MSPTPEQQFEELTKSSNASSSEVLAVFDQLKPIKPDNITGFWNGKGVQTGHPTENKLTSMSWAGKTFRSTEDVDPIMVHKEHDAKVWNADWGHARLRQIEWRGVLSTAMVYDDFPIIDYFRYVNDEMIAGAMDAKTSNAGTFYFCLYK